MAYNTCSHFSTIYYSALQVKLGITGRDYFKRVFVSSLLSSSFSFCCFINKDAVLSTYPLKVTFRIPFLVPVSVFCKYVIFSYIIYFVLFIFLLIYTV